METGARLTRTMRLIQTVADHLDELLEIERLQDRVAHGLRLNLLYAAFSRGGEDDDVRAGGRIFGAHFLDELVPVDLGHHEIEEDQIESAVAAQLLQAHRPILGQLDVELHPPEHRLQENADGQVIVDDEYFAARAVDLSRHDVHRHPLRKTYRAEA